MSPRITKQVVVVTDDVIDENRLTENIALFSETGEPIDLNNLGGGGGGGSLLFHHATEAETSYTIPDGSDYFVLADDYNNEVVLPVPSPGRIIRIVCTHVPRFGSGNVDVVRPDALGMNPDFPTTTHFLVVPGSCLTLISNGVDWWVVSQYGEVS